MKIQERFAWAISVLDIKPTNNLLEIGCGAGILAGQIAGKLTQGTITAVDKSEAMIKMATKRNSPFIETGKVAFLVSNFAQTKLKEHAYDKIFAFNVNVFWKDPKRELSLISHYLTPNGQFYLFYQAPYEIDSKAAEPIQESLQKHSFQVIDTILKKMEPTSALCIITQPFKN